MFMRNGIRSTLRARGRTALFTALILILTVFLTLGLGIWAYCALTLSEMDKNYKSIALVEYMGEDYPEKDLADEAARQAAKDLDGEAMGALKGVSLWEDADQTLASLDGYERTGGYIPYESYGVLQVSNFRPLYEPGTEWVADESRLPETCILINTVTEERTYYAPGLEPFFVARYIKIDGEYYHYECEGDEVVLVKVPADQLAEVYHVFAEETGERIEFRGGVPLEGYDTYESEDTVCYYDPLKGLYAVPGQVICGYSASVDRILQAEGLKEDTMIWLELGDVAFEPESGISYLIHGTFVPATTSYPTFRLANFPDGDGTPPYLALSGEDDPALSESVFTEYAAYYDQSNNYVRLEASDDVAAAECFQQSEIHLEQGRFPAASEAGVCVVDGWTAKQMGLSLGDTVDVRPMSSALDDRFDLAPGNTSKSLEVIGITNASDDYMGCLWVSGAEGGFGEPLFGYQLGRAVLDNGLGRQAADQLQALVPAGVKVTLYDQGYATAAQPIQAMESAALSVTVACACGVLVVLILFASLFVGRSQETVQILVSLGTPSGKIRLWLLSGAAVVSGAAALVGALAGGLLLEGILKEALASMERLYAVDQRYSEAAVGAARELAGFGTVPKWPAVVSGVFVFALALVLCLLFLGQARRQLAPKKGRTYVREPRGGTSVAGSGALRFALLSARRGGWRSYVVPAAALILTLLLGLLLSGTRGWESQIDELYGTARIDGQVTSTNGRQSTDLVVSARNARLLWESGSLSDISVSLGWNYWLTEEMPDFGTGITDTRDLWIAGQPEVIALNNLAAAPAFYYGGLPEVSWLDGWDSTFLAGEDYYSILESVVFYGDTPDISVGGKEWLTYPCLANASFLEGHGLSLGDTWEVNVRVKDLRGETKNLAISLLAVGAYTGAQSQQEIYVPLSFWCSPSWLTGQEPPLADGERPALEFYTDADRDGYFYANTTFSTCRFTLRSAYGLEGFRDYLAAQGISQVGQLRENRMTVVLGDEAFVQTASGLNRYVTFGNILLPALCVAVGLLGFVISWLMVNGRKMEFAIMRGLGASPQRTFGSFFLEQAGLALAGCVLGGILLTVLAAGVTGWIAAAILAVCYFIGSALAVLFVERIKLITILTERE